MITFIKLMLEILFSNEKQKFRLRFILSILMLTLMGNAQFSLADDYQSLDLRSSLPPLRDQDNWGTCYAQSAADIETVYFQNHPPQGIPMAPQDYISPDSVAICANSDRLKQIFAEAKRKRNLNLTPAGQKTLKLLNGLARKILARDALNNKITSNGDLNPPPDEVEMDLQDQFDKLCAKANYPDPHTCQFAYGISKESMHNLQEYGFVKTDSFNQTISGADPLPSALKAIEKCGICFTNKQAAKEDSNFLNEVSQVMESYESGEKTLSTQNRCTPLALEAKSSSEVKMIFNALKQNQENPALAMMKKQCNQAHSAETLKEMESRAFGSKIKDIEGVKKLVSDLLGKKQIVGVVYDPNFLVTDDPLQNTTEKDKEGHASTIVAQKMVNQELKYWIRSSWGAGACEKALAEQKYPRFSCDQGYYVVSANEFLRNSSTLEFFQ
jgi:hypothetical protein